MPAWPEAGRAPAVLHVDDMLLHGGSARIELADGVRRAHGDDMAPDAFVAIPPWRPATPSALLRAGVVRGLGTRADTVALLSLPAALLRHLREGAAAPGETNAAGHVHALDAFLASTRRWRIDPSGVGGQGYCRGTGATDSATRDATTQRRVGLHLDHWDRMPLQHRERAQNRLCVNLGQGVRALQLIPVAADELDVHAGRRGAGAPRAGESPVHRFLGVAHAQAVVRLLLLPGDAYIAPTERFIHDGCVLGPYEDLTFTCRGVIAPVHPAAGA